MAEDPETKPGVWGSLNRALDMLLAIARNRVALFAVELQIEKCRLVEALLCAAAVAAFGMMSLTLVTLTVVFLFWDNWRIPALAGLSLLYLVGTFLSWRALRSRLDAGSAFADTVAELDKDRACLDKDK